MRPVQVSPIVRVPTATEKEEFLRVFGNQSTAAYLATPSGTIVAANQALLGMLGFGSLREMRSHGLRRLRSLPRFSWAEFRHRVEAEGQMAGLETVWKRRAGSPVFAKENVWTVRASDGTLLFYEGIVLDSTGSRATEALTMFRTVFGWVPVGLAQLDLGGRFLQTNAAFQAMLGYSEPELQRLSYADIVRPADVDAARARFDGLVTGAGDFLKVETRYHRKNRSTVWVKETVSVVRDADRKPLFANAVVQDITQRKKAEETLGQSEDRFSKAFQASPVPISISRIGDGTFVEVNDSFLNMLGFERDEVIGRTAVDLGIGLAAADRSAAAEALAAGGPMKNIETLFRRKSGDIGTALSSVEVIELGGERCLLSIIYDVTEQKRAEAERLANLKHLEELDAVKTQFINMAAHELRTPLAPMRAELHLLKTTTGPPLDADKKFSVDLLERNMGRLSHLVEDLLEVARMQAGRLSLEKGPVRLRRIVADCVASYRAQARESRISLTSRLLRDLTVDGDPKRVAEVVENLLSNALKFTPRGGRVFVEMGRTEGFAVVKVRDTGVGLRQEDIPKLFQSFSRLHDPKLKVQAGTGLGLFICKGIIDLHGGSVGCESDGPGRGSTFSFTLPIVARPRARPRRARQVPPSGLNAAEPPRAGVQGKYFRTAATSSVGATSLDRNAAA